MELIYKKEALTQNNVSSHQTSFYPLTEQTQNILLTDQSEEKQDFYRKKLKRLRLNHLLGQKEMAVKFNISQQSYAKLEAGKTLFTQKKIEKICRIFNIEVQDFAMTSWSERLCQNPIEPSIVQVLKMHYEKLLLQQEKRIKELEISLQGNKTILP
jgi:transcriptional regulator with XRE-family HTH domain